MTRILIRCDASLSIGSGHVMRCRNLARLLQQRGADVTFICRKQPGDLIQLLENEFSVLKLPEQSLLACEGLQERHLYEAWLGCSQEQDAVDCLNALTQANISTASWLVVDHYGLDAKWEGQLLTALTDGSSIPQLLAIDDLADRPHQANLLLDSNFFGDTTENRYSGLVPENCRQLLGPHYALLAPEYPQLHPLVPIRTQLKRVLVFFGGVDQDNLTSQALQALMDSALSGLAVDVVIGRQSPHWKAVKKLVDSLPNATLHAPLPSLAGLMVRADLAIGAGGTTTWERACLGLPSLVIAIASNQLKSTQALHRAGHLRLLGMNTWVRVEDITTALLDRLHNPDVKESGNELTDGWGVSRQAMAMLGPQEGELRLRPAIATDEALLLRWANDPQVRSNSFTSEQITPEDHHRWFQKGLNNPSRMHLIALTAEGCPVGQIRFDKQSLSPEGAFHEAVVALSLDRCARGHGLAGELLRQGLKALHQQWGATTNVVAEVLTTNTASNACFARAGFKQMPNEDGSSASSDRAMNRWHWQTN
jgi:UDP-2,4-diacetamido-2,4,6-trideoxy-beta-L-altropyranose hydrolase